ncbi:hypothetical protein MTO96_011729 [Rhipicephalus appendiculatus]
MYTEGIITVLSDKLASSFSWNGRKEKNAFKGLHLSKCIVDAVTSVHKCNNFAVESAIKDWLRHAPARCASEKAASHWTEPFNLPVCDIQAHSHSAEEGQCLSGFVLGLLCEMLKADCY